MLAVLLFLGQFATSASGEIRRFDVINFAGLFSGTAVAPPRSVGIRLAAQF